MEQLAGKRCVLEGEVELPQGLHRWQVRGPHGGVEPTVVAQRDLGIEQLLNALARGGGPAVGLGQDVVHGLQGAGHLEIRQHRP